MTLIEGDGIGPEISKSVKDIFAAADVTRTLSSMPCKKKKKKKKGHRKRKY